MGSGVPEALFLENGRRVIPAGTRPATRETVTRETKTLLALLALVAIVLLWIGGTVAALAYAAQPGNAGAVILAGLAFFGGYGFVQEAGSELGAHL